MWREIICSHSSFLEYFFRAIVVAQPACGLFCSYKKSPMPQTTPTSIIPKMKFSALLGLATILASASANWVYKTRPDLSPPVLNITVPAKNTSPGYLFLAPYNVDLDATTESAPGAYIYTDTGDLVWSGFGYFLIWGANFQKATLNGEDVLFAFEGTHNAHKGHGHGHVTFLNKHYETIKEVRGGNHRVLDKHEFHVKDGKTGLATLYHTIPTDLTSAGGAKDQQWIIDARIQELDLETGELLFEWSSAKHVGFEGSLLTLEDGLAGGGRSSRDAWDYFHINSVDKDDDGDYLISARHFSTIYKISGKTGEIIWRIGGIPGKTKSDFKLEDGLNFSFQHHARFLSTSEDKSVQVISFFDNGAYGSENGGDKLAGQGEYSSSKIIEVNTKTWEVKQLYKAVAPGKLLAKSQGSTQVLPNGHVVTGWGSQPAVTEFDENGKAIFHAFIDSGPDIKEQQNYRAFRYEWEGQPKESIALLNEYTPDGDTIVHVSWNGDTRTKTWRFYEVTSEGRKNFIGEKERTGFETSWTVKGQTFHSVAVEAIGKDDVVLGSSIPEVLEKQIVEFKAGDVGGKSYLQSFFNWGW